MFMLKKEEEWKDLSISLEEYIKVSVEKEFYKNYQTFSKKMEQTQETTRSYPSDSFFNILISLGVVTLLSTCLILGTSLYLLEKENKKSLGYDKIEVYSEEKIID